MHQQATKSYLYTLSCQSRARVQCFWKQNTRTRTARLKATVPLLQWWILECLQFLHVGLFSWFPLTPVTLYPSRLTSFFSIYLLAFAATDPTVLTCMYILEVGLFGWHAACNIYKSLRRCCSCWIRLGEDNKIRNISPWYVSHGWVVWRSRNEEKLMNVPLSRLQHWGLGCGRRDD